MSRRRTPVRRQVGTHQRTVRNCECGRPTRDQAYVCEECLDGLAADLRALVPTSDDSGLWIELWSVIADERGVDYRSLGGSRGGAVETGIVLDEKAATKARHLARIVERLVAKCIRGHVPSNAPTGWRSRAPLGVPAAAEWLSWRVTGMAHHPEFADAPKRLQRAVAAIEAAVMPLPRLRWLGSCAIKGCDGDLYARRDETFAVCDICEAAFEAAEMRDRLVGDYGERLHTAADIAKLYDLEPAARDRLRKRINKWAQRDRLLGWPRACDWTPGLCPWPAPVAGRNVRDPEMPLVFRLADAFELLGASEEPLTTDEEPNSTTDSKGA